MANPSTRTREEVANAAEKVKETASSMVEQSQGTTQAIGEKADEAAAAVGGRMKSLAGTLREHQPSSGAMKSATSKVADTLEGAGKYLEREGLTGMGEDMTNMIRQHPIAAVLVGVGVGYFLSRLLRS